MSDQYLDQASIGELATASLRLIGAVASGETPTADEVADAVKDANRMVAGWANRRGLTLGPVQTVVTAVAGQASYPLPAGFVRVDAAVDNATGQSYGLTDASVDTPGPLPNGLPLGLGILISATLSPPGLVMTLYGGDAYWAGRQIALFGPPALPQWLAPSDPVDLPPGWDEAIVYNLAKRLAPQYGSQCGPEIIEGARQGLKNIQALTTPRVSPNVDPLYSMQSGGPSGGWRAGYTG